MRQTVLFDCLEKIGQGQAVEQIGAGEGESSQTEANGTVGAADHVNIRVLLVEDSATSQMAIKQMITRAGFACDVAGNGEEALRAMERIVYQIVLMDLQVRLGG